MSTSRFTRGDVEAASRAPGPSIDAAGLADAMRARTRSLHRRAERSGVVHAILQGEVSRAAYVLLLRNLLPAYRALEQGLERHREAPGVRAIAWRAVFRADALVADLDRLCGAGRWQTLPLLPAGAVYERCIQRAAGHARGERLIAHAYTRFLGDLNGGQVLRSLLARRPGIEPSALSFYSFERIDEPRNFAARYRRAFDEAGREVTDAAGVVHEAALAFRLNVSLSCAVARTRDAQAVNSR